MRLLTLVLILMLAIASILVSYYHLANRERKVSKIFITKTEVLKLTETVTLKKTQKITTTVTRTETLRIKVPILIGSVSIGEELSIVKPFLYHEHLLYHYEGPESIHENWYVQGEYLIKRNGVIIQGEDGCTLAYNKLVGLEPFRAYWFNLTILRQHGPVRFILYLPNASKKVLEMSINTDKTTAVYVNAKRATYQKSIDMRQSDDLELLLISSMSNRIELFVKRLGIDDYWVAIAQVESRSLSQRPRFAFEVCNSSIVLREFRVNLAAGTGIRDLRPIFDWSNGKYDPRSFLKNDEGYMLFFATESYFANGFTTLLFLKTKDLLHYEPVKSIIVKQPGYSGQGVLFKWIDGKIHGFLMDWSSGRPPFQGGLHRILKVVLDENLDFVSIDTNVKLINPPLGGSMGHYDITLFKYNGTWYAITSSFTGGTVLWKLDEPTSTTFTYVKIIFPGGFENPMIYPVKAPDGSIQFMLSVATAMVKGVQWHRIYILDDNLNPLKYYNLIQPKVYSGGHSFYLDPWYLYVHQDQLPEWRFISWDIGPGVYLRIYRLITDYRYYIEEK